MRSETQGADLMLNQIETVLVKYDPSYPHFGLRGGPEPHKQHPNQKGGLDLYVSVVNLDTGEWCWKKLYENKKGRHFKHTGYSPMYLDGFTCEGVFVPFQFLPNHKDTPHG